MIKIHGVIPLVTGMGHMQVQIWFRIFQNLVMNEILGLTYIHKCIHSILPMEREIVPGQLPPVAILGKGTETNWTTLLVHEALVGEQVKKLISIMPDTESLVVVVTSRYGLVFIEKYRWQDRHNEYSLREMYMMS